LLAADAYEGDPHKVDVWALGATIFNACAGRYPLFNTEEPTPRIWDEPRRSEFEAELARRAREEWESRVDLDQIHPSLRPLLSHALDPSPATRWSARELREHAERELVAFLRTGYGEAGFRFSPIEELKQLRAHLPEGRVLALMPVGRRQALADRLRELTNVAGLSDDDREVARELLARIA
jgi:serine/threonine protein kinase